MLLWLLLGFSLYLRDLKLNFFQITKGLRFNSYPFSLPNSSFLPLAVDPVGVSTYWCYFLRIIVYNLGHPKWYSCWAKYKIRCGQEGLAIMPLFFKQAVKMGDTIFQHLKPQSLRFYTYI